MINIRNLSVQCGHCETYQTLVRFEPKDEDWNVYVYECDNDTCEADVTRTRLEVPVELDAFARRDPDWHGGARHAGAEEAETEARRRRDEGLVTLGDDGPEATDPAGDSAE